MLLGVAPGAHAQVSIAASDPEASESPLDNGQFTVTRPPSLRPDTVRYVVTGTATPDADYVPLSGRVSFRLLDGEATISVNVRSDGLFEGNESVTVRLLADTDTVVTDDTASVTIIDTAHSVTASTGSNATEDPVGAGEVVVTLGGENQTDDTVTVDYTVAGTATPGTDYAALSGVALIPVGSSSASIEVTPVTDDAIEGDETVEVTLTATNNDLAPLGDPLSASVTIADDEASADDDGDGLTNLAECPDVTQCRDTDEDGTPDFQDADDDDDTVPTASENAPGQDTDSDSIADFLDNNDDGDARATRDEDANADGDGNPATDPTDLDEDGIADYLDPDDQGGPTGDLDGDGLTNEREAELGTDPEVADTDGDGVGDGDEVETATDPLDSGSFADADGDLVPDTIETAAGSDPNDPASFQDSDGGGTADHIETISYTSHGVTATNTQDGQDDRRDFDGDGLPDRLEITIGGAPDSSDSPTANGAGDDTGNGVSNAVEAYLTSLGIAPIDAASDFDRDGYPDATEVALALDPLTANASDSDGDGVPNVVEVLAGVDVDATTDSDADGVPDAREVALGANPMDTNSPLANGAADDDGDGVSNAIENVLQTLGVADGITGSSDNDADGLVDADEIRFGTDPLRDEQPVPWIELSQAASGPVRALTADGGVATASAIVGGHQTGLAYDWSDTDNAVLAVASGPTTGSTLTFAPSTLPPGIYNLALRVQRTVGSFSAPESVVDFTVNVLPAGGDASVADADNDGIPDSTDERDARNGFANTLLADAAAESAILISADPGVRLQLGTTARIAGANSARVTLADIAAAGDGQGGSAGNSEDEFDYIGGIYNFDVTNLPEAGSIVQIVIPQAAPIGEFPEYRKFLPGTGWSEFVEDENNSIESAAGAIGECPAAGDESYAPGLTPGHLCIQLSIEDGGPNDGDGALGPNGVIKDPGGVGTPKGEVVAGQGGGSVGPAALILLTLFVWRPARRRRRAMSGIAIGALCCCCLFAIAPEARADAFVGGGVGMSSLDPATAGTPFSIEDDQDVGYKVFGGFDITPVSPNLSVEVFWADLGQATLNGNGMIDYSLYGAGFKYGIGSVAAPRFSGFVEAGVASLDIGANVPFSQQDDTSVYMGIGGSFAILRHLFLQLEYQYFAEDAQFLSLSLVKRFRVGSSSEVETMPLPEQ